MYTLGFLFHSLDWNQYCCYLFCCSNCSPGSLWSLLLCPFNTSSLFFLKQFLTFWLHKILQAHLVFPDPGLESSTSPRSPGPSYWRKVFRDQHLGTRLLLKGHYFYAFQRSELGSVCMYTHIYVYFCIYYLSVYTWNKLVHIDTSNSSLTL